MEDKKAVKPDCEFTPSGDGLIIRPMAGAEFFRVNIINVVDGKKVSKGLTPTQVGSQSTVLINRLVEHLEMVNGHPFEGVEYKLRVRGMASTETQVGEPTLLDIPKKIIDGLKARQKAEKELNIADISATLEKNGHTLVDSEKSEAPTKPTQEPTPPGKLMDPQTVEEMSQWIRSFERDTTHTTPSRQLQSFKRGLAEVRNKINVLAVEYKDNDLVIKEWSDRVRTVETRIDDILFKRKDDDQKAAEIAESQKREKPKQDRLAEEASRKVVADNAKAEKEKMDKEKELKVQEESLKRQEKEIVERKEVLERREKEVADREARANEARKRREEAEKTTKKDDENENKDSDKNLFARHPYRVVAGVAIALLLILGIVIWGMFANDGPDEVVNKSIDELSKKSELIGPDLQPTPPPPNTIVIERSGADYGTNNPPVTVEKLLANSGQPIIQIGSGSSNTAIIYQADKLYLNGDGTLSSPFKKTPALKKGGKVWEGREPDNTVVLTPEKCEVVEFNIPPGEYWVFETPLTGWKISPLVEKKYRGKYTYLIDGERVGRNTPPLSVTEWLGFINLSGTKSLSICFEIEPN